MIQIKSVIDLDDLAWQLVERLNNESLIGFIKAIDRENCDLDFTKALQKYFNKEMADYEIDCLEHEKE
jgi:hypothetical protein